MLGSHPGRPGVLDLLRSARWLRVTYSRGWTGVRDVPRPLRQAAAQMVGDLLSNREAGSDFRTFEAGAGLPLAVSATLGRSWYGTILAVSLSALQR